MVATIVSLLIGAAGLLAQGPAPDATPELPDSVTATPTALPSEATAASASAQAITATAVSPIPAPTPAPLPTPTPIVVGRVTAIGDSVMLGAAREMRRSIAAVEIDATVSRQASAAIRLLRERQTAGRLGEVVIVHIGNNGPITATQFDQLMQPLAGARLVVVVNLRVPRAWESGNNAVIAAGVARHANAVLLDWHGFLQEHPELIGRDGTHLGARSARAYTALVVDALLSVPRPTPTPEDVGPEGAAR
jgi:hypothetical protein